MKSCLLFLLSLTLSSAVLANCNFIVNNYSDATVNIEAGFYNGKTSKAKVAAAASTVIPIKADLDCKSVSAAGFGITFINLIDGKSQGGWLYQPDGNLIRATGKSYTNSDGVVGQAPGGEKIVLMNNPKPQDEKFEVSIEKASRNISRQVSSMN
jgi:hypothetical protein